MTVQELIDALQKVKNKDHRLSFVISREENRDLTLFEQAELDHHSPAGWVYGIDLTEYHPDDREVELRIYR